MDEALLTDILQMLVELLSSRGPPDAGLVAWLSDVLHADQGALVTLLARSDQAAEDLPETTKTTRRLGLLQAQQGLSSRFEVTLLQLYNINLISTNSFRAV